MLNIGINGRSLFRQLTGVQLYAMEITRALCAKENEDVRFTVFAGREGRSSNDIELPVSPSFFPAGGSLSGVVWEQGFLRRMTRKAGTDILFSPANMAPLNPPVPSVVTIHDLAFLLFPGYFSHAFARYYRAAIPRISQQAAAIITDSTSTKNDLLEHLKLSPDKVSVVPLGVSARFRHRLPVDKLEEVRLRYRLPAKFFLSIASLEPRKNLRILIRAYRLLPLELRNEIGLVLTGTGGRIFADAGVTQEISRLDDGRVVTTGYVPLDDLVAIYRLAETLVYPSLYEGFGLPVLEAMASSTPVITSNRSSLPEVAGSAAILVNPEQVEEIAAAMELVASDSGTRNLLIERGKKRSSQFTWEASAEKTIEIIKSAADQFGLS